MSGTSSAPEASQRDRVSEHAGSAGPSGWTGWVVFAGVLLITVGAVEVLSGLVALFDEDFYLVGADELPIEMNYTAWGTVHLVVGILAAVIGVGLLAGNVVARGAAVLLAGFSAVASLASMSAQPGWFLLVLGLDVAVIYAVTVHGGELEDPS